MTTDLFSLTLFCCYSFIKFLAFSFFVIFFFFVIWLFCCGSVKFLNSNRYDRKKNIDPEFRDMECDFGLFYGFIIFTIINIGFQNIFAALTLFHVVNIKIMICNIWIGIYRMAMHISESATWTTLKTLKLRCKLLLRQMKPLKQACNKYFCPLLVPPYVHSHHHSRTKRIFSLKWPANKQLYWDFQDF